MLECTMTTTAAGGAGTGGGDRTVCTLVFQRLSFRVLQPHLVVGVTCQ